MEDKKNMKHISLPKKFTIEEEKKGHQAKIFIEPCYPGYGITLGNAIRRVLLSSLPGGAVTAVKIKGVSHEFSALEGVSEDMVEIILNLKQLKVKVYGDEPVVLNLKAKGEKQVTGADIKSSSDAEIVSQDLIIANITKADTELDMEITVAKGVGYSPTEERQDNKEKGEIGVILVDSIFTPVLNVGLDVEATRVGQKVDYDKIILDIETDGTISPEEAVQKAAEILVNQFSWIMEGGREDIPEVDVEAPVELPEKLEEAEKEEGEEKSEEEIEKSEEDSEVEVPKEIEEEKPAEDGEAEEKPKKRGRPKKTE